MGGREDAIAAAQRATIADMGDVLHYDLGLAYAAAGDTNRALEILSELNQRGHTGAFDLAAMLQLAVGDKDQAVRFLEAEYNQSGYVMLSNLKRDWFDWVDLRGHPRYEALLQRLNIPE